LSAGNPFTEQVPDRLRFVGRESELRRFETTLDGLVGRQPSHTFVAGVHGTGKTSFLSRLVEMAGDRGCVATSMSMGEPEDPPLAPLRAVQKILKAIAEAVDADLNAAGESSRLYDAWNAGSASTMFRQANLDYVDSDAILYDLRVFRAAAERVSAKGIVVCLDEAQRLPGSALSALKNALQHENGVLFVLSLRLLTDDGGPVKAGRDLLDELGSSAEGDMGASRLFITRIPMGPFGDYEEGIRCITRRLDQGPIDFEPRMIRELVWLASRVPRDIINYAAMVWDHADAEAIRVAGRDVLQTVVGAEHATELRQARQVAGELTGFKRTLLQQLVTYEDPVGAEQLAQAMAQTHGGDTELVAQLVAAELKDLLEVVGGLRHADETFFFARPVDAFMLRIALEAGR
jgi:hypothetical protein